MLTPKNITKKQAARLLKLIERETRCEIMARFGRFDNLDFADYAAKQIEFKHKIHKLVFGTSNILELGYKWKLIKKKKRSRK